MNLLNDDIDNIAGMVKLRAMARGPIDVHVEDSGAVRMRQLSSWRRTEIPDRCRVGIYTRAVECGDIRDDLIIRMREIARR